MKKNNLLLISAIFCLSALLQPLVGQVLITEIMYNASGTDTGFEWVEIYNAGSTTVDVTGWKLSDEDDNNINWSQMTGTLAAGEVGIITQSSEVDFKASWPTATNAKIFTSTNWGSIANTVDAIDNEVLSILDGPEGVGTEVDVANYMTIAPWPVGVNGSSIYLLPGFIDPVSNDDGSNWAASELGVHGAVNPLAGGTYAVGNIGSPGVVVVPEPGTIAFFLGLLAFTGVMIRRRR